MAVWLSFCAWTLLEQARIVPTFIPLYIVDMIPQNSNVWIGSGMPQVRRMQYRGIVLFVIEVWVQVTDRVCIRLGPKMRDL